MGSFIPFSEQELIQPNSKYYGGRDITGKLLPADWRIEPDAIVLIDIEGEHTALIKALDGKVVVKE